MYNKVSENFTLLGEKSESVRYRFDSYKVGHIIGRILHYIGILYTSNL